MPCYTSATSAHHYFGRHKQRRSRNRPPCLCALRTFLGSRRFKVDLVFYHCILKCYVLIDQKREEIKHGDIGQMNMYLNYFKTEICQPDDNPPIGIVLGAKKDELLMEYATQGITNQLFTARYQLYLPKKEELQAQLDLLLAEGK